MCKSYTAAMIMAVLLMGVGLALGASIDFESPTYSTGSVAAQDSWVVSAGTANVTANGTLSGSQELEVLGGSDSVAYRPVSTTNFTETTTFSFLFSRAVNLTGNFYLSPGSAPGARTVDVYVNFSSGINAYDGAALVNVLGEFTADHVYEVTCTLYFDNQTYDVTARDLNDGSSGSVKGINFTTTSHTLADYAPGGVVAVFADYNTLSVDDIVVEGIAAGSLPEGRFNFETPFYTNGTVNGQDSWVVSAGTANVTTNGTLSGSQELEVLGGSDSVAYRPVSTTNFTETTTFSFLVSRAANLTGDFYLSPGSVPGARTVDVYVNFSSGINAYDGAALVNVLGEFTADHVYEVTCTLYFDNQTYDVTARDLNDGSTGSVKGINFRTTSHTLADYAPGGVVAIFADYNTLSVDDIVVEETVAETVDTVDFETAPYILGSVAGQDGWVILAGEANVRKNGISGLQEVRVDKDTVMSRTFDGSAFGNDTAFSFLVSHVQNMTAEIYLSTGNGTPGGTKTASFYLNYSDGIGAFNGGTVSYVLSEFDPYDVYKVDCVVHFTSQTYDVMVRNLTDDTSASQKGLLFRTSPHTLDEFTTAGGVVGIRPSYGTLFLDNVTVEKLFSGTVIMLR